MYVFIIYTNKHLPITLLVIQTYIVILLLTHNICMHDVYCLYYLLSAKILVWGGRNLPPLEIIDLINSKLTSDIVVDENGSKIRAT